MCGIAGLVVSPDTSTPLEEHGHRMVAALRHRGPDSHGIWTDPQQGLLLVHDRLAIQDLSELGHQPMRSQSGRYCIVFNGEIYNFQELAKELLTCGYSFSGHSDTEVLLCAIEEWGLKGAVQRSVGMFALALWDAVEHTLSLCRDRLGEKPLYYGWLGKCFYFASELQAIEAIVPDGLLRIDRTGLKNYLQYGYITAPHSIYHGIFKLVPGTILSCPLQKLFDLSAFSPCADTGPLSPKTFWSVRQAANSGLDNLFSSEAEATEELDLLLHKTIKMQSIADVGVGIFLSGGIDSSTVAAIAQSESTNQIKTFSIGFSEKEYDESTFAGKIATHLGTEHSRIDVSPRDTLEVVPLLPSIYDEPFADSSQIPTYLVSRFARTKVTVCLSGDGGDELFAGYNRYISTDKIWNKLSRLPYVLRSGAGRLLGAPPPGFWDGIYNRLYSKRRNEMQQQKLIGLKLQKLAGLMQQRDQMEGYDYLLSYWSKPEELISADMPGRQVCPTAGLPDTDDFISRAMYLDQIGYLQGDNLTKVDRASMAVSLETRLPLLSHEVVELAWRIPVGMKVRQNVSKWALRQVLYRYVPRNLIERPKMGFSVPVAKWLREDLREWAEDLLCLLQGDKYTFLDERPIRSAWNRHLAGTYDHSQRIWTILMLLSWMERRNISKY